jgi:DNA-binding response OmpR family regulator
MGCVFVIDDDDSLRKILCSVLERSGFEVHGYSNLDEAIGEFDGYKPQAAIVDLAMPGSSIQDYVASMASECCSVIVYSGDVSEEDHVELLRRGAMCVLHKPLSPVVVAEYVRKAERYSTSMRVMRKLQPASKELRDRLQRSNDALSEFTTKLRAAHHEPTTQAV